MLPVGTQTPQKTPLTSSPAFQSGSLAPEEMIAQIDSSAQTDVSVIDPVETTVQHSGMKHGADFNQLPPVLLGEIGAMLSGPSPYSQTSHRTRLAMEIQYWDRLTPACRAQHPQSNPRVYPLANPGALYADYVNRQDRYQPETYLNECGVIHPFLINQIKKGRCSITEALGIVQKNRELLVAAIKGSNQMLKHALANPTILHCVECGLLGLEQISEQSTFGIEVLKKSPVVLKYLASGELLMEEVLGMTLDQMGVFNSPDILEDLLNHQVSLKDLLSMTSFAAAAFSIPFVQQSLADKTLRWAQFLRMTVATYFVLVDSVLLPYLLKHQLKIQDFLNITSSAYGLLQQPRIRDYIDMNPLEMARVLHGTPAASRAFEYTEIEEALSKKELFVDDVLTISDYAQRGFDNGVYEAFIRDGKGSIRDYITYYGKPESPRDTVLGSFHEKNGLT